MKFVTSNEQKKKEIKQVLPDIQFINIDLPEVDGDYLDVIINKSMLAGENTVVEDTILEINGKEIVDIKWKIDSLKPGDKVLWRVSVAYNSGQYIKVWTTTTNGRITDNPTEYGYMFDKYIIPEGYTETVAELDKQNRKHEVSPRTKVLLKMLTDPPYIFINIHEVKEWKGSYQNKKYCDECVYYEMVSLEWGYCKRRKRLVSIDNTCDFYTENGSKSSS